ncbi:hypothetical protein [Pseudoalteromonas pernae]|uniref:hypothetical protein n=1 Tax=Pseudoalteromonas pernae TaxID=3118054 RepID=UPI003241F7FA
MRLQYKRLLPLKKIAYQQDYPGNMEKSDLTSFKCPELFVRFKLALIAAQKQGLAIEFTLAKQESASVNDIQRYLKARQVSYKLIEQEKNVTITVETVACV